MNICDNIPNGSVIGDNNDFTEWKLFLPNYRHQPKRASGNLCDHIWFLIY